MKYIKSIKRFLKENYYHYKPEIAEPEREVKPHEKPKEHPKPHVKPFKPKPKENPKPKALLQALIERVVTYSDNNRMNPEIENNFNNHNHPLAHNKAYPSDEESQSFSELMASKRFQEVISKLKYYLKINKEVVSMSDIIMIMHSTLAKVKDIESKNKEKLKKLAVKLIEAEFGLHPGDVEFDIEFETESTPDLSDMQFKEEDIENLEELDLEIQKRKILNSLTHGAAVKTTYAYHLIERELNEIHPGLVDMYSILSILSEYGYWIVPPQDGIENAGVGKLTVDLNSEPPKIMVVSISFPYVIHELTKGVIDILTHHDDYLDAEQREKIRKKTDNLHSEHAYLQLGPYMWEKLNDAIYDSGYPEYRNNIIAYLSALKASEFNDIMKDILAKDNKRGIDKLKRIAKEIEIDIKDEERKNF